MDAIAALFMTFAVPTIFLLLGFGLGSLMKFTGGWRFVLAIFMVTTFYPWGLHVFWTRSALMKDSQPILELYEPQLADVIAAFMSINIVLGVCAFIAASVAVWRTPLLSTGLPLLLGFLYWHISLGRSNGDVAAIDYDLLPIALGDIGLVNLWLFWFSIAASAGLFGYVLTRYLEPSDLRLYFPLR